MTQLLFLQLFHQLPHLLPNPFHILFSHPCLWLAKPLSHVPSIMQDGLPNTEPPTISSWLNVMLQCCTSGLFNIVQDFIVVEQEFYKPLNSGPGGGIEVREGKPKSNIKILF